MANGHRDNYVFVDGTKLTALTMENEYSVSELAERAGVAEQTIRNYESSTTASPRAARRDVLQRVADALGASAEDLTLGIDIPARREDHRAAMADWRFLGDPSTVRSIAGVWDASSRDVEIPGVVTYKHTIDWHGQLTIEQDGAHFIAHGTDKDDDGVFAKGVLLESGNWIRFDYWIDNQALREYGTALAEFKGDGRTIEGLFVGRDAGHSSNGLVVAHLTLLKSPPTH